MASAGGSSGGGGSRVPSYRERENNKKRERRRRSITSKIFAGLRTQGNYPIPRNCNNNEVLKALCAQAGWTVEPDGTTYRKGCKPGEHMQGTGGSAPVSPCSSYNFNFSPYASYHPSVASSPLHSPASYSYVANANVDGNSLIPWPWLNKLSASSSLPSPSSQLQHVCMQTGSISAPITSPFTSSAHTPQLQTQTGWNTPHNSFPLPPTPPNSSCNIFPNPEWSQIQQSDPGSPTFSLISPNPFDFNEVTQTGGGSHMWNPGQSAPALPASTDMKADVSMDEVEIIDEFAFHSSTKNQMNPWEGERIHEEFVSDDLKLTLGTSHSRHDK